MTRIFDALKKSDAGSKAPAPSHAMPAPFARPSEVVRGSLPLMGSLPIEDAVMRAMSALRVSLESTLRERTPRVLMFIGPQGGEGASTVALQFALVLARDVKSRPLV